MFILAVIVTAFTAFTFSACKKDGKDPVLAGEEKGAYYLEIDGGEYTLTLDDGEKADIVFGTETKTGKYSLDGEKLTITVDGEEEISATYRGNEIVLALNGEEKVFFKKVFYSVSFVVNGGVAIESQRVLNGKTISAVNAVREHYSFAGWYADEGLSQEFGVESEKITKDTVLYAKWDYIPGTNVLTLDQSEGTTTDQTVTVTENQDYSLEVPVVSSAYEFKGWMTEDGTLLTDENGNSLSVWNPSIGDAVLYAKLEIILTYTENDDGTYTVTGNSASANVEEVIIPAYKDGKKVTIVYGFADYTKVKTVSIPATVTLIDEATFIKSAALSEYEIYPVEGEDEPVYMSENGVIFTADKHTLVKYPVAKNDTEYKIPAAVLDIAPYAFADMAPANVYYPSTPAGVLETVILPKNLRSIGDYAFHFRNKLTTVKFENGSASEYTIGAHAFECVGLTTFSFDENLKEIGESAFAGSMYFTPKFTAVSFGESSKLVSIGAKAFENAKKIESAVIPASVRTIGSGIFSGSGIKTITFEEGSLLEEIPANAFNSSGLTAVSIPEGVTKINDSAFFSCQQLLSLELPSSLKTIGSSSFNKTLKLKTLTLPENLERIGASAFEGSGLTEINFNQKLTFIGQQAFRSVAVSKIDIPASVTEIGVKAFENCDVLTEIVLHEGLLKIGEKAFYSPAQGKGQPAILDLAVVNIPSTVTDFGSNIFSKYRNNNLIIVDNAAFIDYFVSCEGFGYTDTIKIKSGISVTNETFLSSFVSGETDGTYLSYVKKAAE